MTLIFSDVETCSKIVGSENINEGKFKLLNKISHQSLFKSIYVFVIMFVY